MIARLTGRSVRLLHVEELEQRNPASTALDVLFLGACHDFAESGLATEPDLHSPASSVNWDFPELSATTSLPERIDTQGERETPNPSAVPSSPIDLWDGEEAVASPQVPVLGAGAPASFLPTSLAGRGTEPPTPTSTPLAAAPAPAVQSSGKESKGDSSSDSSVPKPTPGPLAHAPGITLVAETEYIPVNANRTNGSQWQKEDDGTGTLVDRKGFPLKRDFDVSPMRDLSAWNGSGSPPAGPAIADPELKSLTATVILGQPGGSIQAEIIYANPASGGRIRLWTDQTKTTEIASGGTLPDYPTCTFYAEGINPSIALGDVTVRAKSTQGAALLQSDASLSVTPIVSEFSVNPKSPPLASLNNNE